MTEDEWWSSRDVPSMLRDLPHVGERKARLFVAACCRRVAPLIGEERYGRLVARRARDTIRHDLAYLTPAAWRGAVEEIERSADLVPDAGAGAGRAANLGDFSLARRVWETHQAGRGNPGVDLELGAYLLPALLAFTAANRDPFPAQIGDAAETLVWAVSLASGRWGWRRRAAEAAERAAQCDLLRDLFGNPFRASWLLAEWVTPEAGRIARRIYEERDFDALPVLADALEEAGCDDEAILGHGRAPGEHVRGCWVVDLVLGKA